jgi:hypothetical protein
MLGFFTRFLCLWQDLRILIISYENIQIKVLFTVK